MRVKYATNFDSSYPAAHGLFVRFDVDGASGIGFAFFFKYGGGLWYMCESGGGWHKLAETA